MGTLNPEEQLLGWVTETKEAVLLVCQQHHPSGDLPERPWFLSKSKDPKVQSTLAELLHRANHSSRQFSHHVGEYLGSLSSDIESCVLALSTTTSDMMAVGTEMKRQQQQAPAEPSSVTMTLATGDLTFALLSRGEAFGQHARLPVTVELDLDTLTVLVQQDNSQELVCPRQLLSKLDVAKLSLPGVALERQLLLKSGQTCEYQLIFHLNSLDRSLVLAEQLRVLDDAAKQTSDKKKQLEEERRVLMKALGIDEELKASQPEPSRTCDWCVLL